MLRAPEPLPPSGALPRRAPPRRARRGFLGLVAAALLVGAVGCGGAGAPPPPKRVLPPAWQDVFVGTPDLYVVIRPPALKSDPVYGSFWRSIVSVAKARSWLGGATMLEAAEGADEIIVGVARGNDAALVLRGVPANIEPQKMVDASGRPLFRADVPDVAEGAGEGERPHVQELVLAGRSERLDGEARDTRDLGASGPAGALFVLADRTWVGTLGRARDRARHVYASPSNRPVPAVAPEALVAVRLGPRLLQSPRIARHAVVGLLRPKLVAVTAALEPARGGLVVTFEYDDLDAAARAEENLSQLLGELARDEARFGWLKDAKLATSKTTVTVKVAIPARLLEELPRATGADVPF